MELHERVMAMVKVNESKSWNGMACMEWQGQPDAHGYGRIKVGSKIDGTRRTMLAHRVSWQEFRGLIPFGMCVLHRCDNRTCCNPAHLFLGTKADNSRDMTAKGRQTRGQAIYASKLRDTDIPVIRQRLAAGESQASIARDFGVMPSLISSIKTRRIWSHVA